MTFEEKLAAKGRKLDEAKAKIEDAVKAVELTRRKNREQLAADIAELDEALEELDAALDTQVEKQFDTMEERAKELNAQVEKQLDTMEERAKELNAQVEKQFDTMEQRVDALNAQAFKQGEILDAQMEKQVETVDAALDQTEEKLRRDIAKAKTALTLDKATAESVADTPTGIDLIQRGTEEQFAGAVGHTAATEENARRLQELRDGKRSSVLLRAKMNAENAKEKIAARREAIDKAAQEEWILDLLESAGGLHSLTGAELGAEFFVYDFFNYTSYGLFVNHLFYLFRRFALLLS